MRTRVFARFRAERGDTLIEVIIGSLLVALVATATLGGFADIGHLSATQRNEEQAATLAQQDQARMRGLTIAALSSNGAGTGNWQQPAVTVDGTNYTVTSKAQFISGSSGSAACTGSNTADEIQTTSTVTWPGAQGTRNPVVVHGEITPAEGGSLVASVVDPTGAGLAGVTISASGPSTTSPVTTDSSGCVVWAGLASGSYTVSFTPPTGTWIGTNGAAPSSQTVTVTATQTTHATQIQIGQAAAIAASFTTTFNGSTVPGKADTFVLSNTGMTPTPQIFGTPGTYVSTLTTPTSYYPYPTTLPSDDYFAWAGGCTGDEPSPAPTGFTITGGQTNPITIPEPAMIILPHSGTPTTPSFAYDDRNAALVYTGAGWSNVANASDYSGTEKDTTTAANSVKFTIPLGTTSVSFIARQASNLGIANLTLSPAVSGSATTADLYSASTVYQHAFLVSSALLPTTTYTLTIAYSGNKNASSSAKTIDVDEVLGNSATTYSQGPLLATAPHVIVTDGNTGCGSSKDYPQTQVPTATQGALANPGLPYGTFTVCVDDGSNHVTFTGVSNTSFSSPTSASSQWITANIYPGGGGSTGTGVTGVYGTGVCT